MDESAGVVLTILGGPGSVFRRESIGV